MKKEQKNQESKFWLSGDRENNLNYIRELLEGMHYIGMRKDFYGKHACLSSLVVSIMTHIDQLVQKDDKALPILHQGKQHTDFEEFLRQKLYKGDWS
ncbi:hypothetical protein [uncultured Helicobacter sp.]|uniref:hypothetical protein n=1 Tax=uncultured Helicobacter sp. TaxID=175537 RepID=UPI002620F8EE|nr:hypothetical protein [uncultured Helicobacter sp.]